MIENKISHQEIRETFTNYFVERGHLKIPSSSLVPINDPSLLVINSGMAPLKRYFTGEVAPESNRLTNIQKCVRTNDIESVGDNRHLTFFEMMGNWSVGDYFKKEALGFAWELLTGKFKFDKTKLSVTVYGGDPIYPNIPADEEAYKIWLDLGISPGKIHTLGAEHNFWGPAGEHGPCGPCSEVFYDLGEDTGCGQENCSPACDCGRFVEIWNPGVFMQYNKDQQGNISKLKFNNVDAGAGLERFAMILQGVENVFETDLLKPISQSILEENQILQNRVDSNQTSLKIMTDHFKSATLMMSDGIYPGNAKREYVVKRLIRRMVTHGRLLGVSDLKVQESLNVVVNMFDNYYPEINRSQKNILEIFNQESSRFSKTLTKAEITLDKIAKASTGKISGKDAFYLQTTYGLPYEILVNIANLKGLSVDKEEFEAEMEKHRNISRNK